MSASFHIVIQQLPCMGENRQGQHRAQKTTLLLRRWGAGLMRQRVVEDTNERVTSPKDRGALLYNSSFTASMLIQLIENPTGLYACSDRARVAGDGMTLSSPFRPWLTSSSTIGISFSPNARSSVLLSARAPGSRVCDVVGVVTDHHLCVDSPSLFRFYLENG